MQAMDHLLKGRAMRSPRPSCGCDVESVRAVCTGWMCIERAEHKEGGASASPTAWSCHPGSVTGQPRMLALRPVKEK